MKELYLVTGATGHLGNTVAHRLARAGRQVRALVLPGEEHAPQLPGGVEAVAGDVRSPASLEALFAGAEGRDVTVIHCAGIVSIASRFDQNVYDVNVTGTKNVVDACVRRLAALPPLDSFEEEAGAQEFAEGLGAPFAVRRENEDFVVEGPAVDALLLRVRLLRELGLPLAEIRQLRGGDLALGAALDAHLARLGVELERAERSQAVCRDILGSGESFEALDAPRWLAELSARGPKPAEGFDSVPPLICPWRRFFARNLDLMLCTILPLAAAALLFRPNYQPQGFGFTVIRTLVTLAAMIFPHRSLIFMRDVPRRSL